MLFGKHYSFFCKSFHHGILEKANIIYKLPHFDIKSKKLLRKEQKYYLADSGIYFAHDVYVQPTTVRSENIAYTYLGAKGCKISVDRIESRRVVLYPSQR